MPKVGQAKETDTAGTVKVTQEVSDKELEIAFSGPAIAASRVFTTIGQGGVRITFLEQQGKNLPVFRTAAMLPIQQAISLKNVLTDLLKEAEEQIAKAEKQDG